MNNYYINSLPLHNNAHNLIPNGHIIIQTVWNDESVDFYLYLPNKKGFTGTILTSKLSTAANALEINLNEFMAETRNALSSENGLTNFTYYLEQSGSKPTFKWSKSTVKGFRITYGSVDLEEKDHLLEEMMINSIRINQSKDKKIEMLQSDMQRMNESFDDMKMSLEKCVEEKIQLENQLLTKFAALLNSKKDKIVELERAIKNRSTIDKHDSDDGGDDSDIEYSTQTYVREKSPIPSTSNNPGNDEVAIIPKRKKVQPTTEQTTTTTNMNVQRSHSKDSKDSKDIYDRETEVLMDDM